ncbi:MAG: LPS assembly protein LptD [Planctomycetota bacterium]
MRHRVAVLAVLLACSGLRAEEGEDVVRVRAPDWLRLDEHSDEKNGAAVCLLGPLRFERTGGFSVEAARLVIWLDPRVETRGFELARAFREKDAIPLWAIRAIYAESEGGPVIFQTGGQIVRATSIYYDFQRQEGLFLDTEVRLRRDPSVLVDEKLPDFVFRAREMRARGPGRWTAKDVALFSSDYVNPEVSIRVREIEIENENVRRVVGRLMMLSARGSSTGEDPTSAEIESLQAELDALAESESGTDGQMRGVRAQVYRAPIFGWRRVNLNDGTLDGLIVRADVGRIQSLGSGVYLGVGKRSKPIGWYAGAGYIDRRGPLFDGEISVNALGGALRGRTRGSYFRDSGEDFNGFRPPSKDRYWFQNRYRWDFTENWRFDLEYTLLRDRQYLRVYDEGEFKEGKDQESLGRLRYKNDWAIASLIYQWQTIDFLPVVENLPTAAATVPNLTLLRLGRDTLGRPILLQLGFNTSLGNFRFRDGEPTTTGDFRTGRFDLDPTLFLAFNLGPVRVQPFATFRYTWYEETLTGGSANRYAGSAGVRADMQIGRWFGEVQHLINFALSYENLYNVTTDASQLFGLDPVDDIAEWDGFIFRMRNRFLRRTPKGRREFLNFEIVASWFPDGAAPLGVRSDGFAEIDLEWYPSPGWLVQSRVEYFYNTGDLETASIDARWGTNRDVSLWLGFRHLEEDSDVVTAGAEILAENRWRITLFSQYDIKNDDALDQVVQIQRIGKTLLLGVRLKWDPGEDRLSLSFKIDLLEQFRRSRRKRAVDEIRREVKYP